MVNTRKTLILLFLFAWLSFPVFADQGQKVDLVPMDFGVKQTIVAVDTSATPLPATPLKGRKSMIIKNLDSTDILYIGSSTVTADAASTGGFPLSPAQTFQIDLGENTIIYGISTSSINVSVFEAR